MAQSKMTRKGSGLVLLMDLIISIAASAAAVLAVRWLVHPISDFTLHMLKWLGVSAVCSLMGFWIAGTSKVVIRFSSFQSITRLLYAAAIKEVLLFACLFFQLLHLVGREVEVMTLGVDFFFTFLLLIIFRLLVIGVSNRLVQSMETDVKRSSVLIYGLSDESLALMTRLKNSPSYRVEGFLTRARSLDGCIIDNCKVYSFKDDMDVQKIKNNVGICAVLFANLEDADLEEDGVVKTCLHCGLHIISPTPEDERDFGGMTSEVLQQDSKDDFIPDGMSAFGRFLKRLVDIVLSAILLVVFAIPMLICWIAIKLDDGGPAIFMQERVGRFGRPFYILKFRSMRMDAEKGGPALYAGDDDPRLTKVGRFLRLHHLDEMPQLFNVFKGDMAFVGYRPERRFYIEQIKEKDPRYYFLYQIRPGVTSYATLKNGYTDTVEKMVRRLEFDLYYLRHRSVAFDVEILWRTFAGIVFGKKF